MRKEGFKHFKELYNKQNNRTVYDDPNMPYPIPKVIYNQVKNSGCSEWTFKSLSLQDFVISDLVATCHHLKCFSLALYYMDQMECFTGNWDARDNQGEGMEVVDFCQQVIGIVGVSLYHLMADVQAMVGLLMWCLNIT